MPSSKPGFSVCAGHNSKPKDRIARTLRNVMAGIFFIRLIGNHFSPSGALTRSLKPKGVRLHGRRVTKVGPQVKHGPEGCWPLNEECERRRCDGPPRERARVARRPVGGPSLK